MTGAAAGAGSDDSTGCSVVGAAVASVAGCSNGGRGVGWSITGGFSSTFAGALTSAFLGLKNSVTRADIRRLTFIALTSFSFFSPYLPWEPLQPRFQQARTPPLVQREPEFLRQRVLSQSPSQPQLREPLLQQELPRPWQAPRPWLQQAPPQQEQRAQSRTLSKNG
ncbi:hypothetical protein L210DRAFT_2805151 [Boletus edulis BED1]|uniref:Uncharacterized protein n=1 Tax=Boletus edulis BED1 TaxID=1328754 RepID=A0AAD4C3Z7_BOLED|nr:hypothetical protein L210DRAFT_2805151 [Boletus edulis BED1]